MSRLAVVHLEVPKLKDILPSGGIPGLTYAFISTQNLIRAQEDGYDMVRKPAFYVENTTTGTKVGVLLMARGKINTGLSPDSGSRRVLCDPDITKLFEVDATPTKFTDPKQGPDIISGKPVVQPPTEIVQP